MNYYSLSPKTIDRIDKLSLEELLLCVSSQTEAQGNLIGAAPPKADSLKPFSAVVSSSAIHYPSGKDPAKIGGKASPPHSAKAKPNPVKTKEVQKQTSKKGIMNYKPLFKLIEPSECAAKGKEPIANIQHAETQAKDAQREKPNSRRLLKDRGTNQFKETITLDLIHSSKQRAQPSKQGSQQLHPQTKNNSSKCGSGLSCWIPNSNHYKK